LNKELKYILLAVLIAASFISGFYVHCFFFSPSIIISPYYGDEILDFINSAEESLDVEVYLISSTEVIDALGTAKDRGVSVRVIVDAGVYEDGNDWVLERLAENGIPVKFGSEHKRYHSKFIIKDGEAVIVGSHNLSYSALYQNREVSILLYNILVEEFKQLFEEDWNKGIYPEMVL